MVVQARRRLKRVLLILLGAVLSMLVLAGGLLVYTFRVPDDELSELTEFTAEHVPDHCEALESARARRLRDQPGSSQSSSVEQSTNTSGGSRSCALVDYIDLHDDGLTNLMCGQVWSDVLPSLLEYCQGIDEHLLDDAISVVCANTDAYQGSSSPEHSENYLRDLSRAIAACGVALLQEQASDSALNILAQWLLISSVLSHGAVAPSRYTEPTLVGVFHPMSQMAATLRSPTRISTGTLERTYRLLEQIQSQELEVSDLLIRDFAGFHMVVSLPLLKGEEWEPPPRWHQARDLAERFARLSGCDDPLGALSCLDFHFFHQAMWQEDFLLLHRMLDACPRDCSPDRCIETLRNLSTTHRAGTFKIDDGETAFDNNGTSFSGWLRGQWLDWRLRKTATWRYELAAKHYERLFLLHCISTHLMMKLHKRRTGSCPAPTELSLPNWIEITEVHLKPTVGSEVAGRTYQFSVTTSLSTVMPDGSADYIYQASCQ